MQRRLPVNYSLLNRGEQWWRRQGRSGYGNRSCSAQRKQR